MMLFNGYLLTSLCVQEVNAMFNWNDDYYSYFDIVWSNWACQNKNKKSIESVKVDRDWIGIDIKGNEPLALKWKKPTDDDLLM